MDQLKIGHFIAQERKKKNYTQKELAELLDISDKTVSKWENGRGFPDMSLLLPLCDQFGITVNELLAGQRLSKEEYQEKAEETMMNLVKDKQENRKNINSIVNWLIVLNIVVFLFIETGISDYMLHSGDYTYIFYCIMIQLFLIKMIIFASRMDEFILKKGYIERIRERFNKPK